MQRVRGRVYHARNHVAGLTEGQGRLLRLRINDDGARQN